MTNDNIVSLASPDSPVPEGTPADEEALLRIRALLRQQGINNPTAQQLTAGGVELFTAKKALGNRYKFLPDQLARTRGTVE